MNANTLLDPFLYEAIGEHLQELFEGVQAPRPSMLVKPQRVRLTEVRTHSRSTQRKGQDRMDGDPPMRLTDNAQTTEDAA